MRKYVFALVAFGLLAAGCHGTRRERVRIERQWPAADVTVIDLEGVNGSVNVRTGTGDVSMVAEVSSHGRRGKRRAEQILETELSDGILSITERSSGRRWGFFWGRHAEITYDLIVPAATRLSLQTVNGRIDVEGVTGALELETVNGAIEVVTPGADLEAQAVNGSIRVTFQEKFEGASLKTVNGSVHVVVPSGSSIDYDIHQVNGNFQTDLPIRTVSGFGVREVSDSVNGGDYPLRVTTVNGSITLREQRAVAPVDSAPAADSSTTSK